MSWSEILVIVVVVWAVIHTFVDYKMSQKVDKLEKELNAHKH
jgi:hypothetical protein